MLNLNQTYIFEALEIIVLNILCLYYYKKNKLIFIIFLIYLLEHLRQVCIGYRQYPRGIDDIFCLIVNTVMMIYSYKNRFYLASVFFVIGLLIHVYQFSKKKQFSKKIKLCKLK